MPYVEGFPTATTVVAAGWANPTNAYAFDNSYAYSETNAAEQAYSTFSTGLRGNQVIDKVFVRLEYTSTTTTVVQGDNGSLTMSIKVYDGSTWQTYQITKHVFAVTTANDESLTDTIGDNSNQASYIDVTDHIDTLTKLAAAQVRLLTTITVDAGITMRWSVDGVSILVCFHIVGGVYPRATATTRKDFDTKEYEALKQVSEYLKSTS